MKRCGSVLLLAALSGSFPASATELPPAPHPGIGTTVAPPYYIKPTPWVEPPHSCKPESIPAATPTVDFIDNRDGTVTHKRTGLVWMRCSLGQNWEKESCAGVVKKYPWKKALQAAPGLNAAGGYASHADWRLPNIKELDSIVETQCLWPSINIEVFPATPPARFWSSTLSISREFGYAWYVRFDDGYLDDGRTVAVFEGDEGPEDEGGRFAYHVRLVRGGQPFDSFGAGSPKSPRSQKK